MGTAGVGVARAAPGLVRMAVVCLGGFSRIGIGRVAGTIRRVRRRLQIRGLLILLLFPK